MFYKKESSFGNLLLLLNESKPSAAASLFLINNDDRHRSSPLIKTKKKKNEGATYLSRNELKERLHSCVSALPEQFELITPSESFQQEVEHVWHEAFLTFIPEIMKAAERFVKLPKSNNVSQLSISQKPTFLKSFEELKLLLALRKRILQIIQMLSLIKEATLIIQGMGSTEKLSSSSCFQLQLKMPESKSESDSDNEMVSKSRIYRALIIEFKQRRAARLQEAISNLDSTLLGESISSNTLALFQLINEDKDLPISNILMNLDMKKHYESILIKENAAKKGLEELLSLNLKLLKNFANSLKELKEKFENIESHTINRSLAKVVNLLNQSVITHIEESDAQFLTIQRLLDIHTHCVSYIEECGKVCAHTPPTFTTLIRAAIRNKLDLLLVEYENEFLKRVCEFLETKETWRGIRLVIPTGEGWIAPQYQSSRSMLLISESSLILFKGIVEQLLPLLKILQQCKLVDSISMVVTLLSFYKASSYESVFTQLGPVTLKRHLKIPLKEGEDGSNPVPKMGLRHLMVYWSSLEFLKLQLSSILKRILTPASPYYEKSAADFSKLWRSFESDQRLIVEKIVGAVSRSVNVEEWLSSQKISTKPSTTIWWSVPDWLKDSSITNSPHEALLLFLERLRKLVRAAELTLSVETAFAIVSKILNHLVLRLEAKTVPMERSLNEYLADCFHLLLVFHSTELEIIKFENGKLYDLLAVYWKQQFVAKLIEVGLAEKKDIEAAQPFLKSALEQFFPKEEEEEERSSSSSSSEFQRKSQEPPSIPPPPEEKPLSKWAP